MCVGWRRSYFLYVYLYEMAHLETIDLHHGGENPRKLAFSNVSMTAPGGARVKCCEINVEIHFIDEELYTRRRGGMTDREAQREAHIHHKDNNSCGSCLEKSRRAPHTRFNYSQGCSSDGERRGGERVEGGMCISVLIRLRRVFSRSTQIHPHSDAPIRLAAAPHVRLYRETFLYGSCLMLR